MTDSAIVRIHRGWKNKVNAEIHNISKIKITCLENLKYELNGIQVTITLQFKISDRELCPIIKMLA